MFDPWNYIDVSYWALSSCLGFETITQFSNFEGMWGQSLMTSHRSRLVDFINQIIFVFQ